MDLISIFSRLSEWFVFAILVCLILILVATAGYLIYKKRFHGKLQVSLRQAAVLLLLFGWFIVVLGLTTLSRGANFPGQLNLSLFSGYNDAWNKWSLSGLQLILFNIIMFIPLGLLVPLLSRKAEQLKVLIFTSLAVTMGIELIQLITATGIFELDDLFHNILGSLTGYYLILAILSCYRERRPLMKPILKSMVIPFSICLIITGIFAVYNIKELGNMPIRSSVGQDMRNVSVQCSVELSDNSGSVSMFRSFTSNDLKHGKEVAEMVREQYDLISDDSYRIDGTNRIIELKDTSGNNYYFNYNLPDGTWNIYTESQITEALSEQASSQKENIEKWMLQNDLLPENAKYQLQDNHILRWDIQKPGDLLTRTRGFYEGIVLIRLSDKNIPFDCMNSIVKNEYIRNVSIISPKQAFQHVLDGDFEMYSSFKSGDRLMVTGCEIYYIYDTKGYFQPVYKFSGYVNQAEFTWSCVIPALSRTTT